MNGSNSQRGVGLIEVMVALLLLSIAVLGFSALQMRAISATDESLVRTKSLTVVRNLTEVMRAYPEAYVTGSGSVFTSVSPNTALAIPTIQAIITSTATDNITVDTKTISRSGTDNCLSTGTTNDANGKKIPNKLCNINQLAARDALMVKKMAADEDIKMAIVTCPGTTTQSIQTQMCVITAWNDTKAMMNNDDTKACANSDGVYKTGSHCLISEAY
ncbi:probable type IV fimbrial biogenesis protein PilV [Psychrobacter arcticus 273-4]|uniref:Probable type IV fimbrial biogenesis protein PilV n=1 Tax=Psychrobacter arcticus (strain DSM 17307 / VKM B-2377 / 273-4) TaxID=259536 RepID=Q4FV53_PSYA2|nr:type IV pilus modification protein PilV [Psychrobacter arcticus]AAZ18105.1 probable type IV fimbrial biogenesis protein PilV [Psychrobacter arcticus 273-4]